MKKIGSLLLSRSQSNRNEKLPSQTSGKNFFEKLNSIEVDRLDFMDDRAAEKTL